MENDLQKRAEEAAERLGASKSAIYKWRSRGIPAEWKIRLVENGGFSFQDFDDLSRRDGLRDGVSETEAAQ